MGFHGRVSTIHRRKRRVSVSIFDCAQPAVAREELDLSAYLIEKPRVLRVEEESCALAAFFFFFLKT